MGSYKSEKERESIHVLPSLVAHAAGYETIVGAHNTVHVQMHVGRLYRVRLVWQISAPTILYGKYRRLQHCLGSDMPGRLHSTHLAWPGGTVL